MDFFWFFAGAASVEHAFACSADFAHNVYEFIINCLRPCNHGQDWDGNIRKHCLGTQTQQKVLPPLTSPNLATTRYASAYYYFPFCPLLIILANFETILLNISLTPVPVSADTSKISISYCWASFSAFSLSGF